MEICAISPADASKAAALHASAFPRGWSAAEIEDLLAKGAFGYAAGPDPLHGFVLAWTPSGEAEILTLVTDPARRRQRLGVRLMNAALTHAVASGASAMSLEVAEDNHSARALYAALGFVEVGRRPRYYARMGAAVDALVLRRSLSVHEQF